MTDIAQTTIAECKRQEESCLYTSTSMYAWLRSMRRWRKVFVVAPIVFGGIASWSILQGLENPLAIWATAISGLLAGLFPAVFKALELDGHIEEVSRQAGSFKNLQDKFRYLASTAQFLDDGERDERFGALMEEMNELRMLSTTPPERFFKSAQAKVKSGDYDFDSDRDQS
jgi:hypothetical protein